MNLLYLLKSVYSSHVGFFSIYSSLFSFLLTPFLLVNWKESSFTYAQLCNTKTSKYNMFSKKIITKKITEQNLKLFAVFCLKVVWKPLFSNSGMPVEPLFPKQKQLAYIVLLQGYLHLWKLVMMKRM